MYDYRTELENDVRAYINENYGDEKIAEELTINECQVTEQLYDELWMADSVTGNASGSYYCNAWKAEEALCHNLDLLAEALESFGSGLDYLMTEGAEAADVTIRCYLLGGVLSDVLADISANADR